ncbi:MAG TPA: ATP-binding cassette domain-containing protein [Dinghuibacter sp.]|uniref:ABC transporter ATP-binding protein n=1 Tax=Dinghuibacter sp. TaxID=2024697 RepID=UPI002BB3EC95|nr:ATP-binding cassette domain-containing protein [Dinghuibacter sp.]HTJ12660.1 ATP-binding cassette domain-containing protein [Dinghuibacter sp.]
MAGIVISLRNIRKSFGTVEVLKGIDLDVHQGENVVVLGRSGSGKSVLIKIIVGLLRPDNGTVWVLGEEIERLDSRALGLLRAKIGFSFQGSALYDGMNVRDNLEFPLVRNKPHLTRREVEGAIDRVLDDVGLTRAKYQWPSELSGGQKKRIGIARTLIMHPEIMLYDEPTAGLDPVTSVEINELINEVQAQYNTSAVIITHDLTCAKATGDRVVMLSDGCFLRQGSFEEVFAATDPRVTAFYNYNFISGA